MTLEERVAILRRVGFLDGLDDATLTDVAERARPRRFGAGQRIVSELEFGADVFVLVAGQAEVSVEPRVGNRQLLGTIGPAATFGEMASLTGELRSATVTAITAVEVLVISDHDFDRLRARRPEIAVSLVRTLSQRLAEAEQTIDALLAAAPGPASSGAPGPTSAAAQLASASPTPSSVGLGAEPGSALGPEGRKSRRGSLRTLWREFVVNRQKDLPFLALAAFVLTLVGVRLLVFASFQYDFAPRDVLRTAYISGFALVLLSGCTALLTFRPSFRRAIAVAFGVGGALICNELGVTLAFDIFYKDIHTPDPNLAFDVERLYRRTEPLRAIAIGLSLLVQAAYLRRFYVRVWFALKMRLRGVFTRFVRS